ncbi:MAG TPA: hypothetical protein VFX49_00685, partial [Chloroflexota bacterium]|nr:hypothetical protein [Chloroflexota bacterium]
MKWRHALALLLVVHGAGHGAGFWMPVPTWFAIASLVPGLLFVLGGCGSARRAGWSVAAVLAAAILSVAVILVRTELVTLPAYQAELSFNALAIA